MKKNCNHGINAPPPKNPKKFAKKMNRYKSIKRGKNG
jgi:hypothetical protein|tara:strand:+ start:261 stop:371 length:111 start_codon:yes stop_codon:yes gene_type:complete